MDFDSEMYNFNLDTVNADDDSDVDCKTQKSIEILGQNFSKLHCVT